MMRFVKNLFGSHKTPAARCRKRMAAPLQVEGLEERSLLSAPASPINYTPDTVFKVGDYWVDVPASYNPTNRAPTELFVWSHGCSGSSEWDIHNVAARPGGPTYITIALDGCEGGCWNMDTDSQRVMDAIADVETHFNIDPQRVVLGGYSSGGDLSYRVAFTHSTQIAGILAENTSPFRDTGLTQDQALAAPSHFHVVHLAHTEDSTYALDGVLAEIGAVKAAGFPVDLIQRPGTHWDDDNGDTGTTHDLETFLLPHLADDWASAAPPAAGNVRVDFANSDDWGTGFTGNITITNTGATAVNGWTLAFDFTGKIDPTPNISIWDATMVSHAGNHYVVRNADWNADIAPGQSVTFGFNADWGNVQTNPGNFVFTSGAAANQAPTVATAARTSASQVTGKAVTLSVLGRDDAGEAQLSYTWAAAAPPAGVSFSANGSNAAKNTTVTFTKAGAYTLVVTIRDADGLTATSTVSLMVSQTLTRVAVSPATAAPRATQQLTASALDQFGNALAKQPAFTWTRVRGIGSVSTTGLFRAPAGTGTATVRASVGTLSGTGTVTVSAAPGISAAVAFADTDDWETGFTGYLTIKTTGPAINGWTLQFNFTGNITQMWDAVIVSHVGNRYVVKNQSWDAAIAAGQSVSFGFNADWPALHTAPSGFVLNGIAIQGT